MRLEPGHRRLDDFAEEQQRILRQAAELLDVSVFSLLANSAPGSIASSETLEPDLVGYDVENSATIEASYHRHTHRLPEERNQQVYYGTENGPEQLHHPFVGAYPDGGQVWANAPKESPRSTSMPFNWGNLDSTQIRGVGIDGGFEATVEEWSASINNPYLPLETPVYPAVRSEVRELPHTTFDASRTVQISSMQQYPIPQPTGHYSGHSYTTAGHNNNASSANCLVENAPYANTAHVTPSFSHLDADARLSGIQTNGVAPEEQKPVQTGLVKVTPRRRGPLERNQRDETSNTRKIGACIRCRVQRVRVH